MFRKDGRSLLLVLVALFASAVYFASSAPAVGAPVVLTFDDIATNGSTVSMPAGYGGVNWPVNMGVWGDSQTPYNPASPPNRVLFNRNGEIGVVESLVTFTGGAAIFDGAYFAGSNDVQFKLYSGANLVGTSSLLSVNSVPTFLASGYAGLVDSVGIVGTRGQLAMDNFTYERIPEPATIVLICMGAISLLTGRRMKLPLAN